MPDRHWQDRARCRAADHELFFHPAGEPDDRRAPRELAAKRICAACEVQGECLAFAVSTKQADGIWGGATEGERRGAADR